MPIVFDFTLIAQIISLIILGLLLYAIISIFKFPNKRKRDEEIMKKLDRIIELLECRGKNS